MAWSGTDIPDLSGKTFVVTGGNAGIGFATASALAAKAARVVIACRSADKADAARARIQSQIAGADVGTVSLDLASLASVRRCADALRERCSSIDGLINNAGVMMPPLQRTEDGFELQFGTNVFGHFALTGLLMPLLEAAAHARVVTVSSLVQWIGRIDFDNLAAERGYRRFAAYAQSKFADLVLAQELHRRLSRSGRDVSSMAAHPGVTRSDLARHSLGVRLMMPLTAQPVEAGALPSLMAATAPEARSGDFFGPGGFLSLHGPPRKQAFNRRACDEALGKRLWDVAQQATGVRFL